MNRRVRQCQGELKFSAYLRAKWLKMNEGMAEYVMEVNPTMLHLQREIKNCKN